MAGRTQNHYHIRCVRCGKVEDAPVEFNHQLEQLVRERSDYKITGHIPEFIGVYPICRSEED